MFTDIVGYSTMINKNQEHALKLLSTHDTIIEPIIIQNGGSIIKKIGDSIFAEFPDPNASNTIPFAPASTAAFNAPARLPGKR